MKSRILAILFFLAFLPQSISAQETPKIDSMLSLYEMAAPDTTKIKLLGELYNYFLYRDRLKAKQYALEELSLSKQLSSVKGQSLGNYHLGVICNNMGMSDSAEYYYRLALEMARSINDVVQMSNINHAMAIQVFYQGQLENAQDMTLETIEMNKEINDSVGLAISLDFLGMINQNMGNYNIALNHIHEGLDIFQKAGDSVRLADSYTHLAAIESNLENREKSIEYNLLALEIYEKYKDVYYQSQALNDIGQAYLLMEDYLNARIFLERGLKKSIEANSRSITGTINTNLGKVELALKQPENAMKFFDAALEIQQKLKETRKQLITKNQVGVAYIQMQRPSNAITILSEVIENAERIDSKSTLRYAYYYRHESYQLLKDYASALRDYEKYKALSDTLFNKDKSRQIEELRTMHDLEQKEYELAFQEEEIKTLNQEVEINTLRKKLYAGGMITFVAVSALLIFGFRQRMKKNKIEREKQEEILRQEIEYKKKELASQTLHLVQKNTFIQELKENLERIKGSPELFKIEFRRIVMLLKRENASDKDWQVFKSYFSEVHDNFDLKLKAIYREISEKELRMASFIKMKLSTKEIAALFNVLPDSVLKSKYRLKKKLHVDKETDLYQFLSNL